MKTYSLSFTTSHHQFYLKDKNSEPRTDSDTFWSDEAFNTMLAMEEGVIGIGTACYGHVKGTLTLLDVRPDTPDLVSFDHVVEGGMDIKSGMLQVMDCPNFQVELEIPLNPGIYRVRIYASGLDTVVEDNGNDFYKIEVWPDQDLTRKVLKMEINQD